MASNNNKKTTINEYRILENAAGGDASNAIVSGGSDITTATLDIIEIELAQLVLVCSKCWGGSLYNN